MPALAILGLVLAGCEPPPAPVIQDGDISGRWVGTRWEDSARVQWLVELTEEGEFSALFNTCYAGELVSTEFQTGTAEFYDGIYRTMVTRIEHDGRPPQTTEDDGPIVWEYEVYELTDEKMVYSSIDFGNDYTVNRVGETFEMNCPQPRSVVDTSSGGRRGEDAWIRRGVKQQEDTADADDDDPAEGEARTN